MPHEACIAGAAFTLCEEGGARNASRSGANPLPGHLDLATALRDKKSASPVAMWMFLECRAGLQGTVRCRSTCRFFYSWHLPEE